MNGGAGTDRDTVVGIDDPEIAERRLDRAGTRTRYGNAGASHVPESGVHDVQRPGGAPIVDTGRRGAEIAIEQTVLDIDEAPGAPAENPDADDAGVKALEVDVAEVHGLPRVRYGKGVEGNIDAVRSGMEDRGEHLVTIDRDRFGDGQRAEATGIEAVDLAVHGRLRDRTREGLARRRAAARIGVIADTRHPGPAGLRVSGIGNEEESDHRSGNGKRRSKKSPHFRLQCSKWDFDGWSGLMSRTSAVAGNSSLRL